MFKPKPNSSTVMETTHQLKHGSFDRVVDVYRLAYENFILDETDISRMQFACQQVDGDDVLDIGVGHCILLNYLARLGDRKSLTAVDIRRHSQAIFLPGVNFVEASITGKLDGVQKHDTVICMEVIEHVEEKYNEVMLNNLRRLAGRRLVVTVPYNEPEPLWWHDKPGGHRQKFDDEKLRRTFPQGLACLFPRYGVDWIFVAEDARLGQSEFEVVDRGTFSSRLAAVA